jgi:predicted amidophosphoribosyltransferase
VSEENCPYCGRLLTTSCRCVCSVCSQAWSKWGYCEICGSPAEQMIEYLDGTKQYVCRHGHRWPVQGYEDRKR